MIELNTINLEIHNLIDKIKKHQSEEGAFCYSFESGPMTDAYFLILLRVLEFPEESLVEALVERLLLSQDVKGFWKLYEDSTGHLSSTIEAYTALLFSGYINREDPQMKKAESFILNQGGLTNAHPSTKFMLALNGLYPWPSLFPFPLFIVSLPNWSGLSFHKFSYYVRAHFSSAIILGHVHFSIQNDWTPDLSHLFIKKPTRRKGILAKSLRFLSKRLSKKAFEKAADYTQSLQGSDGTVQSYASATFYFIYALLALGHQKEASSIQKAVEGLRGFLTPTGRGWHLQNSPSTIWDTALISYALHSTSESTTHSMQHRATDYLIRLKKGDPNLGGWPFSKGDYNHPDLDDTQAVLRSIAHCNIHSKELEDLFDKGVDWLLSQQNRDGGFGAFEKDQYTTLFALLPFENLKDSLIDPSTADLTGRILEFLGNYNQMTLSNLPIRKAVKWLLETQEKNGSWFGRWGVSYIYGTWAAITGLRAVGISPTHPSIQQAKRWLASIQHKDGGWGESCESDKKRTFIPLSFSTLVQTAWAVDALIAIEPSPTKVLERGVHYLLEKDALKNQAITYPTGAGLPGQFYIFYHSYPDIWPLLTLSHYKSTFLS